MDQAHGAAGAQRRPAVPSAAGLVERLREVHLAMLDAVLAGEGLTRVAALAAGAAGAPVAIVVPRLGAAAIAADAGPPAQIGEDAEAELRRYVADRVKDRPAQVPGAVAAEVPISSGDEVVGAVLLLARPGVDPRGDAAEFLHLAAVASLTEVAVEEAKEEVEENLRGSFLEDLRSRPDLEPREIVRRADRLGCDLSRGAVVLCAELTTDRPRHVVATISGDEPGALAQHIPDAGPATRPGRGRVYALIPAVGGDNAPEATLERARRLARRLGQHGTVGLSSFYTDPGEFARAIQEAELVLEVLRQSDGEGRHDLSQDIGTGTYRLLFRVLASHPEEVRSFYEDTVAPLVRYDDQYRTDLVGTLESYLDQNCNMNATAAAIYAHRHTVAYRLERVKELTGLDPMLSEDRERLGLGLKAYRIIAPRLPK
jgi:sugar diacid utilization regulator